MVKLNDYKQIEFGKDLIIFKSKENDEVILWFITKDDNGNDQYMDLRMDFEHANILGRTLIEASK